MSPNPKAGNKGHDHNPEATAVMAATVVRLATTGQLMSMDAMSVARALRLDLLAAGWKIYPSQNRREEIDIPDMPTPGDPAPAEPKVE